MTFSDTVAIDSTSLGTGDIRVTGSGGFNQLATFISVTPIGNSTSHSGTYQIIAPSGVWDNADNGTYDIAVETNQIFDTAGNAVSAIVLGSFSVNLSYTVHLPLVRQ